MAHFLGRLSKIREPDGSTLLDNSMIVYGSSLADGHEHAAKNLPLIIAGRGGGHVKTGRELRFRRDTSMSGLHLSMLQRLDPRVERFGESKRPMTELSG